MKQMLRPLTCALALMFMASSPAIAQSQPATPNSSASTPPRASDLDRLQRLGAFAMRPGAPPQLRLELQTSLLSVLLEAEILFANDQRAEAAIRYAVVARMSDDPAVSQRAAELAALSNNLPLAREMAKRWNDLDGGNAKARDISAALAMAERDVSRSLENLLGTLPAEKSARDKAVVELARTLVRSRDRTQAVTVMRALAGREKTASSFLALAISEFVATLPSQDTRVGRAQQDVTAAQNALTQSLAIDPSFGPAAAMRAELISRRDMAAGRDFALDYLKRFPQAHEVRGFYAGSLGDESKFKEAREQYLMLTQVGDEKARAESRLAAAAYAVRLKDYAVAQTELASLEDHPSINNDSLKLYQGQAAEGLKRYDDAIGYWRAVRREARFWREVQWRIGNTMASAGRISEGRAFLDAQLLGDEDDGPAQVAIIQSHANWLREKGDLQGAYDVITSGLSIQTDHPELIYNRAMLAERLKRTDEFEAGLRRVIALRPDHPLAYNALGYSFAERNVNLKEARVLIDRAIALAPDDAAIMDSVGWMYFREGNFTQSEAWLRRAYAKFRDGEIAVHLAEVLFAQGRSDAARLVLESHGDDGGNLELVRDALKKYFTR